ncbi:MAG: hypothetical protein AAFV88_11350 [Planctomycetota bacterium]
MSETAGGRPSLGEGRPPRSPGGGPPLGGWSGWSLETEIDTSIRRVRGGTRDIRFIGSADFADEAKYGAADAIRSGYEEIVVPGTIPAVKLPQDSYFACHVHDI